MTNYAIFNDDGTMTGYGTVGEGAEKKLVKITLEDLASIFEDAKASGGTLDGADASIDAAIDDPLAFRDYLILVDGTIEFDSDYVRETQA